MRWVLCWVAALLAAPRLAPGEASAQDAGRLVRLSGSSPLEGRCQVSERPQHGAEAEPHLVADPADPRRLIAVWQQDRYVSGGSLALGVSTSLDGGRSWQRRAVPGITGCPSGSRDRNSDPWLAFGPDGTAYLASVPGYLLSDELFTQLVVNHSSDGGVSWSRPVVVAESGETQPVNDKPAVTADPTRRGAAYVTWTRDTFAGPSSYYSRTKDGGATWSRPARIFTSRSSSTPFGNTIAVLPDHTLIDIFVVASRRFPVLATRSVDGGADWSRPVHVGDALTGRGPTDPDRQREIRVAAVPTVATAGAVYVAWAQPLGRGRSRIVMVRSTDGRRWTRRTAVAGRRTQAFMPALAAAPDGTLALSYYDFRRDRPHDRALTTDVWLRQSRDGGATWRESHLAGPFDMRTAPRARSPSGRGGRVPFIADYTGLAAVPGGFGAALPLARPVARQGRSDIFFVTAPTPNSLTAG